MKILIISLLLSARLFAIGYYEIGLNGMISNFKNNDTSYTKTNTYGASIAYRFISASAIEFAYSNTYQLMSGPYSSTRSIIDVASINLLIYVLGNQFNLQPFIKGGFGYMKRHYTYSNIGYSDIDTKDESTTATFGAGIKYMLTGNLAIQGAAIGYISDLKSQTHFIHYTITAGLNLIF